MILILFERIQFDNTIDQSIIFSNLSSHMIDELIIHCEYLTNTMLV